MPAAVQYGPPDAWLAHAPEHPLDDDIESLDLMIEDARSDLLAAEDALRNGEVSRAIHLMRRAGRELMLASYADGTLPEGEE